MGTAFFIVLERNIDGLCTDMDGKSLSAHMVLLDEAATQLGVRPLSEFFSVDAQQLSSFMEEEDLDVSNFAFPAFQQFAAHDGLTTVRALASHAVAQADGVTRDLRECERILIAADQHRVRWHFEIDY